MIVFKNIVQFVHCRVVPLNINNYRFFKETPQYILWKHDRLIIPITS